MVYVPIVYSSSCFASKTAGGVLLRLAPTLFASYLVSGTSGYSRYLSPDIARGENTSYQLRIAHRREMAASFIADRPVRIAMGNIVP